MIFSIVPDGFLLKLNLMNAVWFAQAEFSTGQWKNVTVKLAIWYIVSVI